ncbi:MAG: tetratricopeptide repeat protein [Polyangiaceae bacterium]|nr:tetratricopeptide repeat protein [Polyangiaceae bacterium]
MADCRGELLERARLSSAAEEDRVLLDAHLVICPICRLTQAIQRDFERFDAVRPNDTESLTRITSAVMERFPAEYEPGTLNPRASRFGWRLATAALVLGATAAAGGLGWSRLVGGSSPDSVDEPIPSASGPSQRAGMARPAVSATRSRPAASASAAAAPRMVAEARSGATPPAAPATAATLFQLANDARRAGQPELAIARYRELQHRFPGSEEASLSRVSLGGLLLQRGAAAAAFAEFDAYLGQGGGQRLGAEALFGRGQALRALGRHAEEVPNWEELLLRYPDSPYRSQAKRRLVDLR